MDGTMNIYAKPGDRVVFHNRGGYPYEQEEAAKLLTLGATYTVDEAIVHTGHTDVYLRECPEQRFNSCLFEDAVNEKLKAVIVEHLGLDEHVAPGAIMPEQVMVGADFERDLGASSLDRLELLLAVQEAFDVEISDEDGATLVTVGLVQSYLAKHNKLR